MSYIQKCDKCGTIYEHGFTGTFNKVIKFGKISIDTKLVLRPPHLCKKCLNSFLNSMIKEIKGAYLMEKEEDG